MPEPGRESPFDPAAPVEREAAELFRELVPATVLRTALGGLNRLLDADLLAVLAPPETGRTPVGLEGLQHRLAVPLRHDDVTLAVLLAGRRRPEPFSRAERDVVRRFGVFVRMALVAARDRARAEELAVLTERRRIALRLHDSVGQELFGAGVSVRLARESAGAGRDDLVGRDDLAGRLRAVEQQLGRTGAALRRALHDLDDLRDPDGSPASRAGFGVTLSEQLEAFRRRCPVRPHLVVLGEWRAVPAPVEELLVQVLVEGLSNVERHSRATEVVVSLSFERGTVGVVLQDDGVGPVPGAGTGTGWGIARLRDGCRRLGGDLALTRGEDGGATVRAWVRCA